MQSLGDSTLADFMKSDITSKNMDVSCSSKKLGAASASKARAGCKDDSDIAKYFNDSLVFVSKDADGSKENAPPNSSRLETVAEHSTSKAMPPEASGIDPVASNPRTRREKISSERKKKYSRSSVRSAVAERKSQWKRSDFDEKNEPLANHETETIRERSKNRSAEISSRINSTISKANRSDGTFDSRIDVPTETSVPDRCKLSSWGLPLTILRKYEARGVTSMFPWQADCLSNRSVIENNRNLVYSAPTSAGKTLVAEILLIKTVLERRKKVIFILPFVSVVREKMYYFQDLLSDSGLRVEGFMGGCAPSGGFAATDVAVATIEKANSLLNQLLEDGDVANLGAVVIDELHLIGDPHRGYLLELLLAKLKYITLRRETVDIQLVGMSATLPNLETIAEWLDAEFYKTDYRPIPLNERCKIGSIIYDERMKIVRNLTIRENSNGDTDDVMQLCIETLTDGHSVLIFCPTKNWCENLAVQISATFSKIGREDSPMGRNLRSQLTAEAVTEILEQLKRCPIGLDEVLKNTVSYGVGFHHAGLTMDERDVVEGAFRSGGLRVLAATSTLSSGVNLPARRVIIRSLIFHGKPIDALAYKQMIGRAGRMGKDTAGESILICKINEKKMAIELLNARLKPVKSCLEGSNLLVRALLEAVASEVAYTIGDIELFTKCTFLSVTNNDVVERSTAEAIDYLIENELFMLQRTPNGDERWIATALGKACLAASIPPTDGLFVFAELQRARRCFVLDTELHVVYLVTPLNSSNQIGQIDWIAFLDIWKNITESERRVGRLVGVEETFIIAAIRGTTRAGKHLDVHKRFYTALALHELVREVSLAEVCRKYGCCRGVVQSLQQSAATFAGMITQFCRKLGWSCMELLIGQFQARLQFGVCRELLDLLRLPMLNGLRARSLWREGIRSVAELATANEMDVERALHKALPFESGKEHEGEHEIEAAKRNRMRSVFVTGRDGLTPREAAVALVREARTLVQRELGIEEFTWNRGESSTRNVETSNGSSAFFFNDLRGNSSVGDSIGKENVDGLPENRAENCYSRNREDGEEEILEKDLEIVESRLENAETGRINSKIVESCRIISEDDMMDGKIVGSKENEEIFDFSEKIVIRGKENIESSTKNVERSDGSSEFSFNDLPGDSSVRDSIGKMNVDGLPENREENCYSRNREDGVEEILEKDLEIVESRLENAETGRINSKIVESRLENAETGRINSKIVESCRIISEDDMMDGKIVESNENEEIFDFSEKIIIRVKENIESSTKNVERSNESSDFFFNDLRGDSSVRHSIEKTNVDVRTVVDEPPKNPEKNDDSQDREKSKEEISKKILKSIELHSVIAESEKIISTTVETIKINSNIVESRRIFSDNERTDGKTSEFNENEEIFDFPEKMLIRSTEKSECTTKKIVSSPAILLIRESIGKASESRSPSLFGDSLHLDTQECNVLEQNVIDTLNISAFGDTNFSNVAESRKNTPEPSKIILSKDIPSRGSPKKLDPKNVSKSIVWDDDSWNNTNGVIQTINRLNDATSRVDIVPQKNSQKNAIHDRKKETKISETPVLKTDRENITNSNPRFSELRKIPHKRKFNESNLEKSPIVSVLTFSAARRLSIDSPKSDSDDVIIPSQNFKSSIVGTKNRTRLKLESLRRSRTQRATTPITGESEKSSKTETLKCSDEKFCSIGSVVDCSDDEIPTKRTNASKESSSVRITKKVTELRKRAIATDIVGSESSRMKKILPNKIDDLQIANVTNNWAKFNLFKREILGRTDISLALGCRSFLENSASIGTKIIGVTGIDGKKKSKKIDNCVHGNKKLCGVAISWDGRVVHYISFDNSQDTKVPVKDRLNLLTEILGNRDLTIRCFSFKETYKMLYNCCKIASSCKFYDPKIADWLLDPDRSERSFDALINEHLSEGQFFLRAVGDNVTDGGPGFNVKSSMHSESRATTEAALTWRLMSKLLQKLEKRSPTLLRTFKEVEMATVAILARMELSGIGINLKSLQELSEVIQREMTQLEEKAYFLAGKKFNFSSSKSVAQVLGLHKGKKVSTNKAALEHCENPISSLVISWRKLSTTQIKIVFPLLRLAECNSRIYGNCLTNTATGRISMHEPNLQNVPRDFDSQDGSFVISVRMAFAPIIGSVMLSADYCQLELRILAHLSKESSLCKILRKEGDVFKNIAARWYNVAEEKINEGMRHTTKQLCYGMIYGMGVKTLAETLSVTENEAKEFLETFMSAYPGIRPWLVKVVDEARSNGYVKTLMHRRRFFPALDSQVPSERGQAERQAVNTKVQGSAADIAKKAMVVIDERMRREFPENPLIFTDAPIKRKLRSQSKESLPRGSYLVLQIHDELLYEVDLRDLHQVAKIIQESMERCCSLRVPLPVKLRIGPTWGDLTEYKCPS